VWQLSFGEKMGIVGNLPELGAWDPEKAPLLQWTEGDLWVVHLSLPAGSTFEFKFFLAKPEDDPDGPFYWQVGGNTLVVITPYAAWGQVASHRCYAFKCERQPRCIERQRLDISWRPLEAAVAVG
jgi:hypothetical protein